MLHDQPLSFTLGMIIWYKSLVSLLFCQLKGQVLFGTAFGCERMHLRFKKKHIAAGLALITRGSQRNAVPPPAGRTTQCWMIEATTGLNFKLDHRITTEILILSSNMATPSL